MWQRFTRSLKTAFKGRLVGSAAPRQPPGQSIRNLLSYSSISTTAPGVSPSSKQLGQHVFRPTSCPSSSIYSPSSRFHSSSNLMQFRLPRPPSVPARVTDVGLGTARKFSTARPIFQHLIENVPVAGRAFYELDLDVQKKRNVGSEVSRFTKDKNEAAMNPMPKMSLSAFQPQSRWIPDNDTETLPPASDGMNEEQFDNYFASPLPCDPVVTYLQIPLVPITSSSLPTLTSSGISGDPPTLLDILPSIASEHALHSTHANRISSLYARLDTNRVWEHGATCEALYEDSSGLCVALRVKFEGWTEERVRSILGLAGNNWCTLWQEELSDSYDSRSFIMPTLEVSSDSSTIMPAWDDVWSSDVISQSDYGSLASQPEMGAWSMDDSSVEDLLEDSSSDISNFGPGSIVII